MAADLADIERGEELQLQETTVLVQEPDQSDWDDEKRKIYKIFKKYDCDENGYISVNELKTVINSGRYSISKTGAKNILAIDDKNHDKRLSFEEFYDLVKYNPKLFRNVIRRYTKMLVASPHRNLTDQVDGLYEEEMSFCPPPIAMITFSLVELIIFYLDIPYIQEQEQVGPVAKELYYDPYKRSEAWRFLTYMFVHIGLSHLLGNLVIQVILGILLELVHHWWRVSLVYLAGVIAGSMGTSLTSPDVFLAGASGGVYALITAHIATIIMNWSEMNFVASVLQFLFFTIFCFMDLGKQVLRYINNENENGIGYMAHLFGAAAGLLVGIGVLRNLKVRRWEKYFWWIAMTIYTSFMVTGIIIHVTCPDYFPH
uniref:EF-hand domain-containing protein n=1 Tax=Megaselia scalaris TaxID=36166 RepID=T1GRT4_MEGSC